MDSLLHIRISKEMREKLQILIDSGLYNNQAEIIREAIRDLLLKYKEDIDKELKDGKKQ
jgi:Arc/MetJ-type ribon-helix-helix transcriptional regulator